MRCNYKTSLKFKNMKYYKVLYLIFIFILFMIGIIMISSEWIAFGVWCLFISIVSIINTGDISYNNKEQFQPKKYGNRRIVHFNRLTIDEQEKHLIELEKEVLQKLKG